MITAEGDVTPGEMPAYWALCSGGTPAPRLAWDLSRGNWRNIPTHALLRDMDSFRGLATHNVRTAFVFGNEVDYGLGRIVESYTEIQGFSGRYRPFRTLEEGFAWLQADDDERDDPVYAFGR